jgi:putative two-component system response regulator
MPAPAPKAPREANEQDPMSISALLPETALPTSDQVRDAQILIVDDQETNIQVVQRYLELEGYHHLHGLSDSTRVMATVDRLHPDIVLLDIMMPEISGMALLQQLREQAWSRHLPVIILTAADDLATRTRALDLGATDFLGKPIEPVELIPRIRNALQAKFYQDALQLQTAELERLVAQRTEALAQRTRELETSRLEVLHCLGRACEYRDNETGRHVVRVGRYVGLLGRAIGLDAETLTLYELTAPLHDVGKIGVPDAILLKPGKLTPDEYELVKRHAAYGKQALDTMAAEQWQAFQAHTRIGEGVFGQCRSPILQVAATIALTHHERWDGTGYPLGLAGEDIPLAGRLTAVADVFDSLSCKRPYKPPLPMDQCFDIMRELRGKQFDPRLLDAFFALRKQIVEVQIELAEAE